MFFGIRRGLEGARRVTFSRGFAKLGAAGEVVFQLAEPNVRMS
jgi:hypothetical protein